MLHNQNSENINILFTNLLVEELIRHGLHYFCISPGSRSAPLTIAAARHPKAQTRIIYDERSAAFHALGYARASKKPAVLICSSGTAAANYYPAVIEAYQENIPMIVLTADRPVELRNSGANQTIDQLNLFGKYTNHFTDLPCPDDTLEASFILDIIDEAYSAATAIDAGPVHLNCPFREPLSPEKIVWDDNYLSGVKSWLQSTVPFKPKIREKIQASKEDLAYTLKVLNDNANGIILAGRNENPDDQKAILALAEKLNWSLFADITSGLRLNDSAFIVHHFDSLLMNGSFSGLLSNLPIIHFGGQFVSKRLLQFLETFKGEHIHISETAKIIDPAISVTKRVQCLPKTFIDNLLLNLTVKNPSSLLEKAQGLNREVIGEIKSFTSGPDENVNEISIVNHLIHNIKNKSALFIASSMPIRDMDKFAPATKKSITIGANRGASGIDGTISSATGFALGSGKPTTLIIGDLAFLHDQSSLAMLTGQDIPLTIVLINNQGGGIFSFLPIARHDDVFERNFATPHNLSFKNLAEQFGLDYFTAKTNQDFSDAYSKSQLAKTPALIEIRSNRAENYQLHKELENRIKLKLS